MISQDDAECKIINAIRREITNLWTENIQPSQDTLIAEINKNQELNSKIKELTKNLDEKSHYVELLSGKIKVLEEEIQSFQKVSMISKWEKKVKDCEKEKETMAKQMQVLKMENSRLNIYIETISKDKEQSTDEKIADNPPHPPEPAPEPVPEPVVPEAVTSSEPVPEPVVPEPVTSSEPVPEPVTSSGPVPEPVTSKSVVSEQSESPIQYKKKNIKGVDYYIGSDNIIYNMDYVKVGEKDGRKVKWTCNN